MPSDIGNVLSSPFVTTKDFSRERARGRWLAKVKWLVSGINNIYWVIKKRGHCLASLTCDNGLWWCRIYPDVTSRKSARHIWRYPLRNSADGSCPVVTWVPLPAAPCTSLSSRKNSIFLIICELRIICLTGTSNAETHAAAAELSQLTIWRPRRVL